MTSVYIFLLGSFVCLALLNPSGIFAQKPLKPRNRKKTFKTTESPLNENDGMQVAYLATSVEKVCHNTGDIRKDLNRYTYTCFLEKPSQHFTEVVDQFELCCNMMSTCDRLIGKKLAECTDRFCGCLDMINIVHEPRINECKSSRLPACKDTTSVWGHDVSWIQEDVGFMKVINRNVVLGRGGIAAFSIALILSVAAVAFLLYAFISYRCCRRCRKKREEAPDDVATAQALEEFDPLQDYAAQSNNVTATGSVASTTRSSLALAKVTDESVDNTTKETIEWP